jgi:hypothetical protein
MATVRAATAFLAGIGLAISLTACSSAEDDAAANASESSDVAAQYCAGAEKVGVELDRLVTLIDEGAPSQALKEQRDFVLSAIQANAVPLSQLPDATKQELDAANTQFADEVQAVPEDATPEDASASFQQAVDTLEASVADAEAELGCS